MILTLREILNPWLALIEIKRGRQRIHDQFRNAGRDADGKCQCPYCRGDAEELAELAADYELQLHSVHGRKSVKNLTRFS